MTTHVHFHDFLQSDRKPFEEAKHKRSHGRFATMGGPGAQQKNPGLKETKPSGARPHPKPQPQAQSPLQQVKASAAAKVAQAVAAAKAQGAALGKEAFAVPHDVETLTKGFIQPNTQVRHSLAVTAAKNVGKYLAEMGKEVPETLYHAGAGLKNAFVNGVPMDDRQTEAWKAIGRKVVISTLMRSLDIAVPGAGVLAEGAGHLVGHLAGHALDHVTQHVLEQVTEHIVDHAAEEHEMKLLGGIGRAGHHLFGRARQRRQQEVMAGGDRAFRDQKIDPETMKLLQDWLQTVCKSIAAAPIDMKKIMATAPKANGDKGGPMFGGLRQSGNALLRDEGTSEGARKGWQKRLHGQSQLRKPTPTPPTPPKPKPTFEEMRAHRLDVTPPAPKPRQAPRQVPRTNLPAIPRKGQAPPSTGYKTQSQFYAQGEHRSEKSKTTGRAPTMPTRSNISMGQREREGPAKERQATTAAAQREELRSLQARQGSLSEKEKHRMGLLLREHGSGGSSSRSPGVNPPKLQLRTRGGRRWLGRV